MIEKLFYEDCVSEQRIEELKADPVYALVREMNFKYGLKVLSRTKANDPLSSEKQNAYQMVNQYGIAVCKLFVTPNGGIDNNTTEYCYRSPYYLKQRGSSRADKETLHSTKISSLMAAIKRQEVVPDKDALTARKTKKVGDAMYILQKSKGNSNKSNEFSPDEIHALLAYRLGESTNTEKLDIDLTKCKIELDKMNRADELQNLKTLEVTRFFTNPYYQIGIDEYGHMLVGKFKAVNMDIGNRKCDIEAVEPFKRYINPKDHEELLPFITMTKLAYENSQYQKADFIPIVDEYNESLDAVFCYDNRPTHYDHTWVFTPAGDV